MARINIRPLTKEERTKAIEIARETVFNDALQDKGYLWSLVECYVHEKISDRDLLNAITNDEDMWESILGFNPIIGDD